MEIVVASGKGGTGKTFISSNLLFFLNSFGIPSVGADADVEAPDLILAVGDCLEKISSKEVYESEKAMILDDKCIRCGACKSVCGYEAIEYVDNEMVVIEYLCDGCGACRLVCPSDAINFYTKLTGKISICKCSDGIYVVTGDLEIGEKNSGHLVYEVKKVAHEILNEINARHVIVDSAPGVGCPVISSISGADILIIVVEPSLQSLQGAKKLREIAGHFNVKTFVVINKYDLNLNLCSKISSILDAEVIGRIPYDEKVVQSYTSMIPIIEYDRDSKASRALLEMFSNLADKVIL